MGISLKMLEAGEKNQYRNHVWWGRSGKGCLPAVQSVVASVGSSAAMVCGLAREGGFGRADGARLERCASCREGTTPILPCVWVHSHQRLTGGASFGGSISGDFFFPILLWWRHKWQSMPEVMTIPFWAFTSMVEHLLRGDCTSDVNNVPWAWCDVVVFFPFFGTALDVCTMAGQK